MSEQSINAGAYAETESVGPLAYPEIYANHTQLSMTLWDISMHFGTVIGLNRETNTLQVNRKVSVIISPEQAKALQMALVGVIEKYERSFGKVRFPLTGEGMQLTTHTQNLATGEETSETIDMSE
jgi:hypothetical protein